AAEHVTFELAELCVQLDRLVLVDRARQLTDVDDAADGLRQLVPRLRGAIQPRQAAQRLEVVPVDAVGGEPPIECVAPAVELLFPRAPEVLVERNLVRVRSHRDLALDDLDELLPLVLARREVREGLQGLRLLATD